MAAVSTQGIFISPAFLPRGQEVRRLRMVQSYSQFGQLEADAVATLKIHKEMTLTAF